MGLLGHIPAVSQGGRGVCHSAVSLPPGLSHRMAFSQLQLSRRTSVLQVPSIRTKFRVLHTQGVTEEGPKHVSRG